MGPQAPVEEANQKTGKKGASVLDRSDSTNLRAGTQHLKRSASPVLSKSVQVLGSPVFSRVGRRLTELSHPRLRAGSRGSWAQATRWSGSGGSGPPQDAGAEMRSCTACPATARRGGRFCPTPPGPGGSPVVSVPQSRRGRAVGSGRFWEREKERGALFLLPAAQRGRRRPVFDMRIYGMVAEWPDLDFGW